MGKPKIFQLYPYYFYWSGSIFENYRVSLILKEKMFFSDRNNLNTHFCFSELLILREKRFADFLLGHWSTKKNYKFSKYIEKPPYHPKKGIILHQAPQITLFLTNPISFVFKSCFTVRNKRYFYIFDNEFWSVLTLLSSML